MFFVFKEATPDIIRDEAVRILQGMPQGIRQADLFHITEETMSAAGYLFNNDSVVRNSLYNLEKKRPYDVEKRVVLRKAFFFPKNPKSVSQINEEVGEYEYEAVRPKALAEQQLNAAFNVIDKFALSLYEEKHDLRIATKIDPGSMVHFTVPQIEFLFELKKIEESIQRCKELVGQINKMDRR